MEAKELKTKIKSLYIWLFVSNLAIAFLAFKLFTIETNTDEITTKRINIVGEDNLPRVVISNEVRQHSGRIEDKEMPKRERPAGIIFFNNEGNESGGIISAVYAKDGRLNSGMSFTMDRYNNDQVIQILNNEMYENGNEKIQRGFLVSEFPKGAKFFSLNNQYEEIKKIKDKKLQREKTIELLRKEGSRKRIYLGKSFNDESGLVLYNKDGKPKLKVFIDDKGQPKIKYANAKGKMVDLIKGQK
jgi:hypothetical protein